MQREPGQQPREEFEAYPPAGGEGDLEAEKAPEIPEEETGVMSFENYAEKYSEIQHAKPYIYNLEQGDKKLSYFGADHTNRPGHPQFGILEKHLEAANPQTILVEGFHNIEDLKKRVAGMSLPDAVKQYGEAGFAAKYATQHKIRLESPEPALQDEARFLVESGLPKEHIFAFYFYRMVPEYQRRGQGAGDFQKFMEPYVKEFQEATQWEDFDYSVAHATEIGEDLWGAGLNLKDPAFYESKVDPVPWKKTQSKQTPVNKVAQLSNSFRDRHVVHRVRKVLEAKDRVAAVYGVTHAVMQQPALEKMFAKGNS